jgi:hypothetical protein
VFNLPHAISLLLNLQAHILYSSLVPGLVVNSHEINRGFRGNPPLKGFLDGKGNFDSTSLGRVTGGEFLVNLVVTGVLPCQLLYVGR